MRKLTKITTILIALFGFQFVSAQERNITFEQLPAQAQTFVKKHFAAQRVVTVVEDAKPYSKEYDVYFENGTKIEFYANGDWEEVKSRAAEVPAGIVPAAISQYVKAQYPNAFVQEIKKKHYGYEIEISNGLDLEFDKTGKFLRIDN
ncbi:PepSY-like domain-containing protein [Capnocytophaga sp.]|uniref:PepSY-like domain-containing protein n=1 Tax=Capnocytophaga sp. TaxID=44737 RepID=UPI0026DBD1C0|nr:PepSY-like domain-containing protein [Capnocytophaga sp.]MDO5105444.1 PepSY-like domain-containing protein [Capnocytophaga sp.]